MYVYVRLMRILTKGIGTVKGLSYLAYLIQGYRCAPYGMKSECVKGRQQLLEPFSRS
jgi:hypothetical protein